MLWFPLNTPGSLVPASARRSRVDAGATCGSLRGQAQQTGQGPGFRIRRGRTPTCRIHGCEGPIPGRGLRMRGLGWGCPVVREARPVWWRRRARDHRGQGAKATGTIPVRLGRPVGQAPRGGSVAVACGSSALDRTAARNTASLPSATVAMQSASWWLFIDPLRVRNVRALPRCKPRLITPIGGRNCLISRWRGLRCPSSPPLGAAGAPRSVRLDGGLASGRPDAEAAAVEAQRNEVLVVGRHHVTRRVCVLPVREAGRMASRRLVSGGVGRTARCWA